MSVPHPLARAPHSMFADRGWSVREDGHRIVSVCAVGITFRRSGAEIKFTAKIGESEVDPLPARAPKERSLPPPFRGRSRNPCGSSSSSSSSPGWPACAGHDNLFLCVAIGAWVQNGFFAARTRGGWVAGSRPAMVKLGGGGGSERVRGGWLGARAASRRRDPGGE